MIGSIKALMAPFLAYSQRESRKQELERNFLFLLDNGFQFVSVLDAFETPLLPSKVVVLRHDIDHLAYSPRVMYEFEKRHRLRSTYYFRLASLNTRFARMLAADGCEVGYHYEEISTFVKDMNVKSKEVAISNYDLIRNQFRKNLREFRRRVGVPVRSIVAHGDHFNRKLKLPNFDFITPELLAMESVFFEGYSPEIMRKVDQYVSDATKNSQETYWAGNLSPIHFVEQGSTKLYLLIHPYNWFPDLKAIIRHSIFRVFEEIRYREFH